MPKRFLYPKLDKFVYYNVEFEWDDATCHCAFETPKFLKEKFVERPGHSYSMCSAFLQRRFNAIKPLFLELLNGIRNFQDARRSTQPCGLMVPIWRHFSRKTTNK